MNEVTTTGLARSRARVPWYAFAVFALIAAAATITLLGDPETSAIAATIGVFAGSVAAGFVFIRKAQQVDPGERRAWTTMGVGLSVAAMGVIVLTLQVTITGDAPTFGPIDLFFLTTYALIITGVALLPHTAGHPLQRARIVLDGLIGAISIAALFWVLVLSGIVTGLAQAPIWQRVIGSMYPILDLGVVVVVMIAIVRRSSYRFDPRLVLFAVAVLLQTVGDVSFLVSGVGSSFAEAEPLYAVFLLAAAAFLATALIVDIEPEPRHYADRTTPLWSVLAPYTEQIHKIVEKAEAYVGRRYGWPAIVAHFLDWLFQGAYFFRRIIGGDKYPICSWVVAHAYKEVGLHFGVEARAASPDDIWDFAVEEHPDLYDEIRPLIPLLDTPPIVEDKLDHSSN